MPSSASSARASRLPPRASRSTDVCARQARRVPPDSETSVVGGAFGLGGGEGPAGPDGGTPGFLAPAAPPRRVVFRLAERTRARLRRHDRAHLQPPLLPTRSLRGGCVVSG